MPAVSITGWVLVVRSSCSFGPDLISAPMSSPSAAEASARVAATAGCSPQASSMPTAWEPWPGKTKANAVLIVCLLWWFVRGGSEVEQHRTPGEAAAHAFEQQGLALL